MKFFKFFDSVPRTADRVSNETVLLVEPNDRGGWSLRWADDDEAVGNYATEADALRIACLNFTNVRTTTTPAAKPVLA